MSQLDGSIIVLSSHAAKLVVSMLKRRGRDTTTMRAWTTQETDVRQDPAIAAEVGVFLRELGAKQSVSALGVDA